MHKLRPMEALGCCLKLPYFSKKKIYGSPSRQALESYFKMIQNVFLETLSYSSNFLKLKTIILH